MLLSFPTLLAAFRAPLGSRRLFRQVSTRSLPPEAMTFSASDMSEDEDEEESFEGPPPFCINCVHFLPYDNKPGIYELAKCAALPKPVEAEDIVAYRVLGVFPPLNHEYCSVARKFDNFCGERGNLFKTIKAAEGEGDTPP